MPPRRRLFRYSSAAALLALTAVAGGAAGAARADVVPVVSARRAVTTLSRNEVADIFLGRRARFADGSAAIPIDQVDGSRVRAEFYSRFADMTPGEVKAFWSRRIFTGRGQPPRAVASEEQAKRLVAANPDAIAYIDRSLVDGSVRIVRVR